MLTGCESATAEPDPTPSRNVEASAFASPAPTPSPTPTSTPTAPSPLPPTVAPTPLPTEAVITFYGSDIQVIGSTYDDTPASEDRGRVVGPYAVSVPLGVGFYWGAVAWNGVADAGCKVTVGDRVVLDNTGPNQTSAMCIDYEGVQ